MTPARPANDAHATLAWALYDWANSGFALVVVTVFFPIFLKQYWNPADAAAATTLQLGIANSAAAIVVAVVAPFLGAIADGSTSKKRWLMALTVVGSASTAALAFVEPGGARTALLLFVIASIGYATASIFYDALMFDAAGPRSLHSVSALGFGLGYLGGGLLFIIVIGMTLWPRRIGLPDSEGAIQLSFALVAAWWAFFSLPLLARVREPRPTNRIGVWPAVREGWHRIAKTFRELSRYRPVWLFLLAYWCYIDGVFTMARMAVDYGMNLGFSPTSLIVAILLTQIIGFPASLAVGGLARRVGPRAVLFAGIAAYALVSLWSFRMSDIREFYALAIVIGLVQGGVQSVSRSLFANLIPKERAGEFFGFFNMAGRLSAVVGPALFGIVASVTGNPRLAVLPLLLLFVSGAGLLFLSTRDGKSDVR